MCRKETLSSEKERLRGERSDFGNPSKRKSPVFPVEGSRPGVGITEVHGRKK